MTAALRAELRKYASTRLWWILLLVVVVGAAGYALLYGLVPALMVLGAPEPRPDVYTTPSTILSVYNGGNTLTRIFALVLGVMAMGAEYRHRTMTWTYIAEPRRWVVMVAKAIAVAVFGLLYGAASVAMGVLAAIGLVIGFGGSLQLGSAEVWRGIVLGVVSLALWALIGMGIGVLIKNMLVAMLVGIGFTYLVEPTVSVVFALQEWWIPLNLMPSGATSTLVGLSNNPLLMASAEPFSWWQAGLVLLGWAALPTVAGVALTLRADVE